MKKSMLLLPLIASLFLLTGCDAGSMTPKEFFNISLFFHGIFFIVSLLLYCLGAALNRRKSANLKFSRKEFFLKLVLPFGGLIILITPIASFFNGGLIFLLIGPIVQSALGYYLGKHRVNFLESVGYLLVATVLFAAYLTLIPYFLDNVNKVL